MSPGEIRSFREAAIMLRNLHEKVDHMNEDLTEEIEEVKTQVKESGVQRRQMVLLVLSTVIGPAAVSFTKWVLER